MLELINEQEFFANRSATEPQRPECDVCKYNEFCRKRVNEWNTAIAKYPNACENCCGGGVLEFTENGAPHGEGYWPMQMQEPCSCIEDEKCPQCQSKLNWTNEETAKCPSCNLDINFEDELTPIIPFEKPYCVYPTVYEEHEDLYD